jgi:hypothetical protein
VLWVKVRRSPAFGPCFGQLRKRTGRIFCFVPKSGCISEDGEVPDRRSALGLAIRRYESENSLLWLIRHTIEPGTEMHRQVANVLYVVAMTAVIVGVDLVFFKNRFWERLTANIGIVLVFAAFYFRFLKHP